MTFQIVPQLVIILCLKSENSFYFSILVWSLVFTPLFAFYFTAVLAFYAVLALAWDLAWTFAPFSVLIWSLAPSLGGVMFIVVPSLASVFFKLEWVVTISASKGRPSWYLTTSSLVLPSFLFAVVSYPEPFGTIDQGVGSLLVLVTLTLLDWAIECFLADLVSETSTTPNSISSCSNYEFPISFPTYNSLLSNLPVFNPLVYTFEVSFGGLSSFFSDGVSLAFVIFFVLGSLNPQSYFLPRIFSVLSRLSKESAISSSIGWFAYCTIVSMPSGLFPWAT